MHSQVFIPHPALREFVVSIIAIDAELPSGVSDVVTPYPPTPHQSIIFYGEDPIHMQKTGSGDFGLQPPVVVIGPMYTRVNLKVGRKLKAVRVDFHPGGLYRLLGMPMVHLFDEAFNAREILGAEIDVINEKLVEAANNEERKSIVESYLLKRSLGIADSRPFDLAFRELMKHDGNLSISKISEYACLSIRQFERICQQRIGMTPKSFARLTRFSKAYRLKEANPGLTWTSIAYEAGYFDQMHFIRDFKQFAGVTPGIIDEALSGTPFRMQADLIV